MPVDLLFWEDWAERSADHSQVKKTCNVLDTSAKHLRQLGRIIRKSKRLAMF